MTVLREHAVSKLLEVFGVDLSDWLHSSYPDKAKQHAAIVVVELQFEILIAIEKGDHAAARIAALAPKWRDNVNLINGYSVDITQSAERVRVLTTLRNLAIVPFRRGGASNAV